MRSTAGLAISILVLAPLIGCGGGGGGEGTPRLTVTALVPGTLDSEIPTAFEVQGVKFGTPGDAVTVRLEALSGTPFTGGTVAGMDLPGTVRSDTRIDGTTVLLGVTGAVQVRVIVILGTGETSGPGGAEATVTGPQITGSEPSVFWASGPAEQFTLQGRGFSPVGQGVDVRLTAVSGAPFFLAPGGMSPTLDLAGEILSDTQVRGTMPGAVVSDSTVAHVEVQHSGGWVTADPGPELVFWSQREIYPADGEANDLFGFSVALSGDTAVMGAYHDGDMGYRAGSVYVYVRNGTAWTQQTKLTASDGAELDEFGANVAVDGDTLVASGLGAKAVYVFVRSGTTWTQQAILTAADGWTGDGYGGDVDISGDTIVVGALLDDDQGTASGSAYVFTRSGTTWTQQQKLLAPGGASQDRFGWSVAVYGDTALVGAPSASGQVTDSGVAYVFVRTGSTWSHQGTLEASDASSDHILGSAVALGPDRAVVGNRKSDGVVAESGAAYVFRRSGTTWTQEQKLFAADGATADYFGEAVAIWDDKILVGAYAATLGAARTGAAYLFTRSGATWTEQKKLTAADGESGDNFGWSVAIHGATALVGAFFHDEMGSRSGAAYVH